MRKHFVRVDLYVEAKDTQEAEGKVANFLTAMTPLAADIDDNFDLVDGGACRP